MRIEILRELDLEQYPVFRALLSDRIQEKILIPFVDKIRIIQVNNLPEANLPDAARVG